MQVTLSNRLAALGMALLMTIAAASSGTALFEAGSPGSPLEPIGQADELIDLVQGRQNVLWSAITGNVTSLRVVGWPSRHGGAELAGALMLERPEDGRAGVIAFGDSPRLVEFIVSE